ncbi:methyltransferase [Helicobacter japonicus]|uniref:methyltransferase n=1 Tax=Helicobacter japonicus TaxID=425400 RepID=UPI0023F05022|nr:methyltransferase [Helicobacter japonicus]
MSKNTMNIIVQHDIESLFSIYDNLNKDNSHKLSNDDICTPMECVKTMLDYIPKHFWQQENIRVLDPCCGNGNFGAYAMFKTDIKNIYFNEINKKRLQNCKNILNPPNISDYDFLGIESHILGHFDLIMANPPYSGGGNKNRSMSNKFIESSIEKLNDKGYLCFVTPNNYMTYNNNNTTLKKLLSLGSFLVIDNDAKKYFKGIGSSFSIMIWQKGVNNHKTTIINNYLLKDIQHNITIPKDLPFLPLYISQNILNLVQKLISKTPNNFTYRCDLHNFTQKAFLSDTQDNTYKYRTIHTPRKTRYASKKQDIYDKHIIIIPLSTYFIPYIESKTNTTQSVGYFAFESKKEASDYLKILNKPHFKVLIHLTRYGNFNNIMVLKHLAFDKQITLDSYQTKDIEKLHKKMVY